MGNETFYWDGLKSEPCKDIKGTQLFLKFLKAHNRVTTSFKK